MRKLFLIFICTFILGFLIGGIQAYNERNDKEKILSFITENISVVPAKNDWKIQLNKDNVSYSYSIATNKVGSSNYTNETDNPMIKSNDISELYKAAGISSSISATGILLLKNKKVAEILIPKASTTVKSQRIVIFIVGLLSGYTLGYKVINPEPSMKSEEMVGFLSNKDNWQKIILKNVWKEWYLDFLYAQDDIRKGKKLTQTEYFETFKKVHFIDKEKVRSDIDYKITIEDFTQIFYLRQIMIKKIIENHRLQNN